MTDPTQVDPTQAVRPSDLVKEPLPGTAGDLPATTVEDVTEAMKDVVDPELMVNVVDLGLLYGVHLDDELNATIDMTLTSPTCPLTDRIEYDTQVALGPLVNSATINWLGSPTPSGDGRIIGAS